MPILYNDIYLMSIQLLLLLSYFVVISDSLVCNGPGGLRSYDVDDSLCCNNEIHKRYVNGSNRECCIIENAPSTIYDTNLKLCCNGQILDLYQTRMEKPSKCCGSDYLKDLSHECCGGQEYDPSEQYCCNDQILLPKGRYCCTNAAGETRETDEHNVFAKCCGTRLYNKTIQICINEQVHPISHDICGPNEIIYDTNLNVCCHETGEILPLPKTSHPVFVAKPNYQCVNGSVIDIANNPAIQQAPCEDNSVIHSMNDTLLCCDGRQTKIKAGYNAVVKCCGKQVISTKEDQCCNGQRISVSHKCCEGKIFSGMETMCCHGQLVDKARHVCCRVYSGHEKIIVKARANDTRCCGSSASTLMSYNHHDQCCRNGQVYTIEFCPPVNVSTSSLHPRSLNSPPQPTGLPTTPGLRIGRTCPFCKDSFEPNSCKKRFKIVAFFYKINITHKGTYVSAVIIHSRPFDYKKVTLFVPYQCTCWRARHLYVIYTNRTKFRKATTIQLRLTNKIVKIVKLKSSMSIGCQVNTALKRHQIK